jgi:hypothetical protein
MTSFLHMNTLQVASVTRRLLSALDSLPLACGLIIVTLPCDAADNPGPAKILNFSGRAQVGTGSTVLITKFARG